MASSQSKREHKASRGKKARHNSKERADISQQKQKHVEESKSRGRKHKKRNGNHQPANVEDTSSDREVVPDVFLSVQDARTNGKKMMSAKRSLKKEEKQKRDSSGKRGHSNRRHGEQLIRFGGDDGNSGQTHIIRIQNSEPKDTEDSMKHVLRRSCKGRQSKNKIVPDAESPTLESEESSSWKRFSCQRRHVESKDDKRGSHPKASNQCKATQGKMYESKKIHNRKTAKIFSKASPVNSEDSACFDYQDKHNRNQRRGNMETRKNKSQTRVHGTSALEENEEGFCSKRLLPPTMKSQFADKRRGCQEWRKAASDSERKGEEESDSESEETIQEKDTRTTPRKVTPSYSIEQSDNESGSDDISRSIPEEGSDEEKDGNPPEKGSSKKGSDYEQSKPRSNVLSKLTEIKCDNKERPLPLTLRSKLIKADLSKTLQGMEDSINISDTVARAEITFSPQPTKHRSQSHNKVELSKQSTCLEAHQNLGDGSLDGKNKVEAVTLFTKRYKHQTSQAQILLNLKSKHKDGKRLAAEIGSKDKSESLLQRKSTTSNNKVVSRAKVRQVSKPRICTVSSPFPNTKNIFAENKMMTGKIKMASCKALQTRKGEEVEEEDTGEEDAFTERDLICPQMKSKSLHTLSAFRKVAHWLGHRSSKQTSLKERFLSMIRAVGISGWLFKKRKKSSTKSLGFRKRMAIHISSARLAKRPSRISQGSTKEQMKNNLCNKEMPCSSLECGQAGGEDTEMIEELEGGGVFSSNLPCKEVSFSSQLINPSGWSEEEESNVTDAKFAIVFPRNHQLVKTANTSLRNSGRLQCAQSRRKAMMSFQPDCKFQHGFSRPNGQSNNQGLLYNPEADSSMLVKEEVSQGPAFLYLEEEDVQDPVDVIQRAMSATIDQVHWTQHQPLACDSAAWLNSETLLPRLTIENLSKWTLYKEQDIAKPPRSKAPRERWEAEDVTEDILEFDVTRKQMYKDQDCCTELEKVEDLSRLEEVSESSILLCLKKRFHHNLIYTSIGHILVYVNPFKTLNLYSEDMVIHYQKGLLSGNAPHIFAITEMAYVFSQSSEKEQCIVISGYSGSGKTEAAKAILRYLSRLYQRQELHGKKQPCDVLPILESFGNAKTILNDNSSRFGKFLHVHLRHGFMVGASVSQYLLEKSRVVFQGYGERSFHVFYELLAGLPIGQKEKLYLQEAETYFYLNQGRVCDIPNKQDNQDFQALIKALKMIGLSDDQLMSTWAVVAGILQLGNICFTSFEEESCEFAVIPRETEIQIVANLLHISADLLQRAITHQVTETCYDRIVTPVSVESAIDARDAIAKVLYSRLFDWLLMKINEWQAPLATDSTIGIVDFYGFEELEVNSLEQLCVNFAHEHLQHYFSQIVITQEEEEYAQEDVLWSPVPKISTENCLATIAAKPHGILCILDDQTLLSQATDHTFLQKCHYHHASSPWYVKPKLPLPVFTVQHYAGPVTYQVHKFLNKNHDYLRPEVLDIFSQSHLKLVSDLFQRFKAQQANQREPGTREQGLKHQTPTLVSRFQQSLQDLTSMLDRSHIFFVRCIKPNSKKLPNIFDPEYVACQLTHSGILEAISIRKEGYPIRIPFHHFLIRYAALAGRRQSCSQERDGCAAVLSRVVGDPSELYQIGITKVFLKEKARQMLERQWNQKRSWAIFTLQRNLRGLLSRRQFQIFKQKVTVIQAHFRGHLARKHYRRLKKTFMQFGVAIFVSRSLIHRRREYQDVQQLEIPAEFAALLCLAEGLHHAQINQITEASPPEVKAKVDLSLPPDINNFPFSAFMKAHFQEMAVPAFGHPLQQPLTRLDAEHRQSAVQLNKLILRFIMDKDLQDWQEEFLGNYIASQGLANLSLRDELLSQVISQVWKNPDLEQCQRGWLLMSVFLGTFTPSPALEKPLLKFVSDHGLEGYNSICQHKLLTSMMHTENDPEVSRIFPPTRLEWTTTQRKGKMVLDVHTYKEETLSAEVQSWTTGEQYAGWILSSRGLDKVPRGWSISMFTGKAWQDLPGCDFVLDLIGEIEESSRPTGSSPDYPITPEWDESYSQQNSPDMMPLNIPPAPDIQAPCFPPPSLPPHFNNACPETSTRNNPGLDHYVDDLFRPLLHHGARSNMSDMESEGSLTGRMKGGGKIGPTQQGMFPAAGYSGMMHMSPYQPVPVMGGMMPASMPLMPGIGGMGSLPAMVMPQPQPMVPSVDPHQLAAQQQAVINQQALLMAQQMTLQAMTISQEQQRLQRERSPDSSRPKRVSSRRSPEPSRPRRESPQRKSPEPSQSRQASALPSQPVPAPKPKKVNSSSTEAPVPDLQESPPPPSAPIHIFQQDQVSAAEIDTISRGSFQKKIEYFQRIGQQDSHVKKVIPLSKSWNPPSKPQPEEQGSLQIPSLESNSALPPTAQKKIDQEMQAKKDLSSQMKQLESAPKSEPSREIWSIIKTHQNRPIPPPKPLMPVRKPSQAKQFSKKNDPKEEALAKLRIVGTAPSSGSPEKSSLVASPLSPPPGKPSSSIREKQLPLLNIFAQLSPTSSPLPPPPPVPPPPVPASLLPSDYANEETGLKGPARTMVEDTNVKTHLFSLSAGVSFSYANPAWKLFLRKEVFYPKENFSHPYCLNLLCDQIMRDTYSESCIRISREERRKMKDLLTEFQVGVGASSIPENGIKKRIVVAARDNWANYFSRLFPVKGENGSDVQILGVSHRGLRLLKRTNSASFSPEHLKTLCSYSYADVLSLELRGRRTLQFSLKSEELILHSPKAQQIKSMVELLLYELKQDSNSVIALRSYITEDKSLLNFKKGDFIRLLPMDGLEPGWQFGSIGGRSGLFPSNMVQIVAAPDYLSLHMNRQEEDRRNPRRETEERIISKENSPPSLESEVTGTTINNTPDACHYTMMEFASAHFQEAQSMLEDKGRNSQQKNLSDLVQHTKVPIQQPLLFYSDDEMNKLATKAFMTLMRFMGDQPRLKNQDDSGYIYELLQLCKEKENLRDEVYCQVIKQLTQNPSQHSCHQGWHLLNLLTGYFLPTTTLIPYATKYLQQASSDDTSPSSETARTCQSNLRKIVMYGGRRHLPFPVEMDALLKERSSRRIVITLPGRLQYDTKIKTFTVAADMVKEISEHLGVTEPEEIQEFAIFVSKDDGRVERPLPQRAYIHDYLLEENSVGLNFRKIIWKMPLHFENTIYLNLHYHQVLQNYTKGQLLLQYTSKLEQQVYPFALLQHWAKGAESTPSIQELIEYTPEPLAHLINPDILQTTITHQLKSMKPLGEQEAKISFIEKAKRLSLFGYNVYPVERISSTGICKPCFVALNQEQMIVTDGKSQSLHCHILITEIQRMQTLRPLDDTGVPGLEVNYGSAENPQTVWLELKQAKALYHTVAIMMEAAEGSREA